MTFDAKARRRYARQLLLGEIGEAGQRRLLKASFHQGADADADAYAVAAEYLRRAGCEEKETKGTAVRVPASEAVMRFAGSAFLRSPAAAVIGAFAAVEHLKQVLEVGEGRDFPLHLKLQPTRERSPSSEA